jgi:hypothetical protein
MPCRKGYNGFDNETLTASTWEMDAQLRASHAFDLPYVSLALGLSAGASLFHQRFDTRGDAPDRWTGAGYLAADLSASYQLPSGWMVSVGVEMQTYLLQLEQASGVEAEFAVRPVLAFGKRWAVTR